MASIKQNSFTFFRSFLEAADGLDGEGWATFVRAILDYGLNRIEPTFADKVSKALFAAIRPNLDSQSQVTTTEEAPKEKKRSDKIRDCSSPGIFLTTASITKEAKAEFIKRYIINKEPFNVIDSKKILTKMPYDDFLKTPYWKAIATYVKNEAKRQCQMCGKYGGKLNVHHKTYKHHGEELSHIDDLICVCGPCHKKLHNKMLIESTETNAPT